MRYVGGDNVIEIGTNLGGRFGRRGGHAHANPSRGTDGRAAIGMPNGWL
jgi:hypothetical protein